MTGAHTHAQTLSIQEPFQCFLVECFPPTPRPSSNSALSRKKHFYAVVSAYDFLFGFRRRRFSCSPDMRLAASEAAVSISVAEQRGTSCLTTLEHDKKSMQFRRDFSFYRWQISPPSVSTCSVHIPRFAATHTATHGEHRRAADYYCTAPEKREGEKERNVKAELAGGYVSTSESTNFFAEGWRGCYVKVCVPFSPFRSRRRCLGSFFTIPQECLCNSSQRSRCP